MALEAHALTTLDRAKKYLGRFGIVDAVEDELVELDINGYSRACIEFTSRQFKPVENAGTVKKFRYNGLGLLDFAVLSTEAQAVTLVRYGTDGTAPTPIAWTADDFRLEPRNKTKDGTYLYMNLPRLARGAFPANAPGLFDREVEVTGTWGMAAVPSDVELACLIAVANAWRNPEGFESRDLGGGVVIEDLDTEETSPGVQLSLPPDSRNLLQPYVRMTL